VAQRRLLYALCAAPPCRPIRHETEKTNFRLSTGEEFPHPGKATCVVKIVALACALFLAGALAPAKSDGTGLSCTGTADIHQPATNTRPPLPPLPREVLTQATASRQQLSVSVDLLAEDVERHAAAEERDVGLAEAQRRARRHEVGEVAREDAAVDAVELPWRARRRARHRPARHVQQRRVHLKHVVCVCVCVRVERR